MINKHKATSKARIMQFSRTRGSTNLNLLSAPLLKDTMLRTNEAIQDLAKQIIQKSDNLGDIVLLLAVAHYEPDYGGIKMRGDKKSSPYLLGPMEMSHTLSSLKPILHNRMKSQIFMSAENIAKQFSPHNLYHNFRDQREEIEEYLYDQWYQQLNLYRVIWDMEAFVRQMYQASRLASGLPFDWYFRLDTGVTQSVDKKSLTGITSKVIRETRDRFKSSNCVSIYNLLQSSYSQQIRNAIAHSQFKWINSSVQLLNYSKHDQYNVKCSIQLLEWMKTYHTSIDLLRGFNSELVRLLSNSVLKGRPSRIVKVYRPGLKGTNERSSWLEVNVTRRKEGYVSYSWVQNTK